MWGNIVSRHLLTNQISDQEMTTSRWGIIVVSQIFQLFLDIWSARIIDGHHLTEKHESQLSRQFNKITTLQESNPEVRYYD
jgi:type II secretory pathway component PulL